MKFHSLLFVVFVLSIGFHASAQNPETQEKSEVDKFEAFVSRKGIMLKFQDFNLVPIKMAFGGNAKTRIRKISSANESAYFYQLEVSGQYRTEVGSIAYDDLVDLINALPTLESGLPIDVAIHPDYLENKYITDDGFLLGYLIRKGEVTWYMKLDDRGTDDTIFVNDLGSIRVAFSQAKAKIEELRK